VLQVGASGKSWQVMRASVFALPASLPGQFDVVHSWGVLHHTGDMYRALRCAAALVNPGGQFVFALYRRTAPCWFWRIEKRWYARASARMPRFARALYVTSFRVLYALVKRGGFATYVENYHKNRGMDFEHNVRDWGRLAL
jgi:SAM-dependent methyltransferase